MVTTARRARPHRGRTILIIVLLLAGLIGAWLLMDWNWLRDPIERRVERQTGREFVIDGDLDLRFGWPPVVVAEGVRLGNAEWAEQPYMAVAERVEVHVRPWAALRGRWVLPSVVLHRPLLRFEWNAQGRSNWAGVAGDGADGAATEIHRLVAADGELVFSHPAGETHLRAYVDSLQDTAADGPVPMSVSAEGRFHGRPLRVSGRVDSPLRLRRERGYRIDLEARGEHSQAHVRGQLEPDHPLRRFDVRLSASADSLARLGMWFELELPQSAALQLDGRLIRHDSQWRYGDFSAELGDSSLHGDLQVELAGERPQVSGDVHGSWRGAGMFGDDRSGQLFPDQPLGLHHLGAIDAQLQVSLEVGEQAAGILEGVQTEVSVRNGQGRFAPLTVHLAGGRIEGSLEFDTGADPMHYQADGQIHALRLPELFTGGEFGREARGAIGGELQLSGHGRTAAEMVGSASGEVELLMGNGRVPGSGEQDGIDMTRLIGFEEAAGDVMRIRCAYGRFDLVDGVAKVEAFAIDTPQTLITGDGAVRLDQQRFDLVLRAQPKEAGFPSLRTPIEVTGPLTSPEVDARASGIVARGVAAVALGAITLPASLLALVETGTGESLDCSGLQANMTAEADSDAQAED